MENKTIVVAIMVIAIVVVGGFIGASLLPPSTDNTTTTTTTTTITTPGSDFVSIVDFIESTFDGTGFADSPDGTSTLDTTYSAVKLLYLLDLIDEPDIQDEINATADAIKDTQDIYGKFGDASGPEQWQKQMALSAACLRMMNRLDDDTRGKARSYLGNYFLGGLGFYSWLTDGVYSTKHYGMWAAKELGNIRVITRYSALTVEDNVFDPGDSLVGTDPETDPALIRGDTFWDTPFTGESFSQRLMYLDSFEWQIAYQNEKQEIYPLLVPLNDTIDEIVALYDDTSSQLDDDITESARIHHLLLNMGAMERIYNDTNTHLDTLTAQIEAVVSISTDKCAPDASGEELVALVQIWLDVEAAQS